MGRRGELKDGPGEEVIRITNSLSGGLKLPVDFMGGPGGDPSKW